MRMCDGEKTEWLGQFVRAPQPAARSLGCTPRVRQEKLRTVYHSLLFATRREMVWVDTGHT